MVVAIVLKYINKKLLTPGMVALFIGLTAVFVYVYKRVFDNWDCFSHWGLVVKLMLTNNCLLNMDCGLLLHYSYPMGTSAFIYYFCRIINASEWTMMLGHAMISLCAIIPVFSLIEKTKIWHVILIGVSYIGMNVFAHPITDIYVDVLLL